MEKGEGIKNVQNFMISKILQIFKNFYKKCDPYKIIYLHQFYILETFLERRAAS